MDRTELMDRIVELQTRIFELLVEDRARAWMDVDLTVQQLKVVFLAVRTGSLTAGQISRELRVGFSTVTGIVDRLAEQGLVKRGEDPNDRRATRVEPTDTARALAERLYSYRQASLRRLLEHVPRDALEALAEGLQGVEQAAQEVRAESPGG